MQANSSFKVTITESDIHLEGMVDRFTVNGLIKAIDLSQLLNDCVTINFSQVQRVDTAGLAWLLKVLGQASQAGQKVTLIAVPEQLNRLAQTCGVEQLLMGEQRDQTTQSAQSAQAT